MEPTDSPVSRSPVGPAKIRIPIVRTALAGVLMGMANLVPGISGGTMIVVMGLYDKFVSSVADATRLRFRRSGMLFLAVLMAAAAVTIVSLAGLLSGLVRDHRSAMYSLFIGMTLGGVPLLCAMVKKITASVAVGFVIGFAVMLLIALSGPRHAANASTERSPGATPAADESSAETVTGIQTSYARDVAAGALGMSAMILPGISGAYMLLILGRYESILGAIHAAKQYATTQTGDPALIASVIIPVGAGALLSLVLLSNLLKWMLHEHVRPTIGILLGILCGSVVGIWPFNANSTSTHILLGAALAVVGFGVTVGLSRIKT